MRHFDPDGIRVWRWNKFARLEQQTNKLNGLKFYGYDAAL